jgi:arylsulfatase A-like enzyme
VKSALVALSVGLVFGTALSTAGIRNQVHHVIDIVPTILEATGIRAPEQVDGITQAPIEGVSLAYTFDKVNATGTIKVDGVEVGRGSLPHTIPLALEPSETFDVGSDTGTGVNDADYQSPFVFDGKLNRLTLKLLPPG